MFLPVGEDVLVSTNEVSPESMPLAPAECAEFARVLGVGAETLTATRSPSLSNRRRDDIVSYEALMADPIKSLVANSCDYFAQLKVELLLNVVERHLRGCARQTWRVLDIGCGPGEMMRCLDTHFDQVFGCDPSQSMVRRAGSNALFMPTPTEIPVADGSVDVAICACVCHHVDPKIRAAHLMEVKRVIRPGGLLFVFEHNPRNPLTQLIVRRCPVDANAQLLSASHTRKLLHAVGLTSLVTKYYLFFPQRVRPCLKFMEPLLQYSGMGGQYMVCARKPNLPK